MNQPLLLICLSLAVLPADVLAQSPVQIEFQTDPVLVQTGTTSVFTVLTVSDVVSISWRTQAGTLLGLWAGGNSVVNPVPEYQGRITITATQLRISDAQLRDAGNYTVEVNPLATTGFSSNTRSILLRVFVAVAGVSLSVPSVAAEGRNVSLNCTWTAGTETTVQWGKGGSAISGDSRITISAGSLVINPARRSDAGEYTCTVTNPVSGRTATQSLTVYYGPDTPVLTKNTPPDCVGPGDAEVGQTVRLTCLSESLPPALFSWQRDGQPIASSQPDSGALILQTFSTNQSGLYTCVARNGLTGDTSEQRTDLAIVGTCLSAGEVAGIVIGSLILLILIILVIVAIVLLIRRKRVEQRQRDSMGLQKTEPNPRLIPPDPPPHAARDLGQGPHPPLLDLNTNTRHPSHLYALPHRGHGNPHTPPLNSLRNSNTHQHNGRSHTNGLLHNAIQNTNSYPHNGVDNPAFTHTVSQNANVPPPHTQQQNPNILIQAGTAQGGAQPPTVHVNLNPLPQSAQQNNNAQMPVVHVNLNSYPNNDQPTQQDSSAPPLTSIANNNATLQNLVQTGQSNTNPRIQRGLLHPGGPQQNSHVDSGPQISSGLIPTGYTHYNRHNTAQRNANTQTYQQDPVPNTRSGHSISVPRDAPAAASSRRRQMPWDRLRGTPAYPNGTAQREQTSPNSTSASTDYTTQPSTSQARTPNRAQPGARSQNTSRSRATPIQDSQSVARQTLSSTLASSLQGQNTHSVTQLEATHQTHRNPRSQRESAQQDIRGLPGSQAASRQIAVHSNTPQVLPLMSHQASVGHVAVSQGPMTQQAPTAPQGPDTRALADPNHLPQAHMAQQHKAAQRQTAPQGLGTQTQPGIQSANQPRQGGSAPVLHPSAQPNPHNLTQAALQMHTQRAQIFQNRNQQTQAALLHPRTQAGAPIPETRHPPTPPPAIPLTHFQALPRERTQHKSPARGPQPPRHHVNIPTAQRHLHAQQHPKMHHHAATMHGNPHHHPGNAHMRAGAQRHGHAHGHGQHAHFTHPRQAHRGRPR
ncbi:chromatin modification-related protein eaf-1 [Myripristis murdjan]|uniref:Chromatin modification-related protein eaf-1-like n=1 Tax=Myripristis murdjan TaxID=586833 RepID=A0A668ASN5_9TELE|nr:chromatin modification-related protein eaf-1-like [Myripristis murdjan]